MSIRTKKRKEKKKKARAICSTNHQLSRERSNRLFFFFLLAVDNRFPEICGSRTPDCSVDTRFSIAQDLPPSSVDKHLSILISFFDDVRGADETGVQRVIKSTSKGYGAMF